MIASLRARSLLVAASTFCLLAGCANDSVGPTFDAPPPRDANPSDCVMTGFATGVDGACSAQWVCRDDGLLRLSCDGADAGIGCTCFRRGTDPVPITSEPPSCSDEATLSTFVRTACGWSDV